jgi:hypothetical protein
MAEGTWMYVRDGGQHGPSSTEHLRAMLERGELRDSDLVWTDGMQQWAPAATVPALSPGGSNPGAHPAAPPIATAPLRVPEPVSYYTGGQLPTRATEALKGHARPTGDTGDWPLDDARVAQFQEAVRARKRVTAGANLYRALLLLTIIADVILVVGALVSLGGGRTAQQAAIGMLVGAAVVTAFAALYFVTARATTRSQRWAPLTMFIIFLAAAGLNLLSLALTAATARDLAPVLGALFSALLTAAFAVVSWRSFAAIPPYLAQPAWCQELIVKANL